MRFESVLFDLDGTLLDTAPDFITVLNSLRAEHGMAALPEEQIRNTVSGGAREMIKLAFGGLPGEPDFDQHLQRFLERYGQRIYNGKSSAQLFSGLETLLKNLTKSKTPWGIVTNKPERFSTALLDSLRITAPVLVCPEHVQNPKPDPEALLLACESLGCEPTNSVYLGDHARDILAGRNADMATIAVAWGYFIEPDPIQAWSADYLVNDCDHLQKILTALP